MASRKKASPITTDTMTIEDMLNSHPCAVSDPTPTEAMHWASGQVDAAVDGLIAEEEAAEERYRQFLRTKDYSVPPVGFNIDLSQLHPLLGDWRSAVARWGIRRGRAAFFEACGLGKTFQELEFARIVSQRINRPQIIFAPLAVVGQTIEEAAKWTERLPDGLKAKMGYQIRSVRDQSQVGPGLNIANFDILEHFDPKYEWGGIVLDESSILKSADGSTRQALIEFAHNIPYRLCGSATPSPNDHMELGNQAEFLGIMTYVEMLAVFFTHDGGDTSKWRLKGHAAKRFREWLTTWCVFISKPSDIGFSDEGFDLPKLTYHHHIVKSPVPEGMLFAPTAGDLQERQQARRESLTARVDKVREIVDAEPDEQWMLWCNLNPESEGIRKAVGACEVTGSDSPEYKAKMLLGFCHGEVKDVVSKVSIAGFGMNMQNCARQVIFPTDSWEQFHQGVRRSWRFGQKREVHIHMVYSESEVAVIDNLSRKEEQHQEMNSSLIEHMKDAMSKEINGAKTEVMEYERDICKSENWTIDLGDSCDVLREIGDSSVDYTIFSPPFSSMYTYTNSDRDMGNCKSRDEFMIHFGFLAPELFRVTKAGRELSFHCMQLPKSVTRDGIIGLVDFRGILIRMFEDAGFVYHSEVCIWKDPVTAMQRTKALGLLHKQVKKDSCMSRQGIADYLVTMRKPGVNVNRVAGLLKNWYGLDPEGFESECRAKFAVRFDRSMKYEDFRSVFIWQRYASPVWMDIDQSRTLNRKEARDNKDERHICPIQLDVIDRALELWTNPNDLVLSPFAGIGSEGFCAIKQGRRFHGVELKKSYWTLACKYLGYAEREAMDGDAPLLAGLLNHGRNEDVESDIE